MSYKIEIQNNFFVVTDTTTGIEEIREVRDQIKWRVSGSIYSFFYNIPNLVDQNSPNIIRLGENAKEFDFSEIVDSTETPFASRAIFNDLLNVNLGFMIRETSSVWGLITGDINDQTDLQTILNGKFDVPTGDTTQYIAGDGTLVTFPVAGQAGTLVREVRNTTGATLTKGTVVYINGANGNKPTVAKAQANAESTSARTLGLLQNNIANNSNGFVVVIGDLTGLDTSAIAEGTQLYLSSTVAGEYTTTKQVAPAHMVYVGKVTRSHPTLGQIEVYIQNGFELDELHDVLISGETDGQVLQFEGASGLWKNKTLATGLTVGSTAISSGTDGRVLFQNGGVLQQSANLFWDNTNSRLGIGTSSPASRLDILAQGALSTDIAFRVRNSANTADILSIAGNGQAVLFNNSANSSLASMDSTNTFVAVSLENFSLVNTTFKKVLGIQSYAGSGMRYLTMSNLDDLHWNHRFTIAGRLTTSAGISSVSTSNDFNSSTIVNLYGVNLINQASVSMRPDFNLALTENNLGLFIAPTSTLNPTKKLIKLMDSTLTNTFFTVNGSGQTGIGTDTPTARLHITAQGALSTDIAFKVRNSANTADWFSVQGNNITNVVRLISSESIAIASPAGQYYPTLAFSNNGGAVQGTIFGYNNKLICSSTMSWGSGPGNVSITGNYTGSGELLTGTLLQGTGNFTVIPNGDVTAGIFKLASYIGAWRSVLEYNTGASSLSILLDKNNVGSVGVGVSTINASAKVQIDSTTKGFLPPRMTNAQRTAIASPAVGLMVYCTDAVEGLYIYKSMGWTFVI
jgi:hypothetical protein